MILGMSLEIYTLLHVVISILGIVSGTIVMYGWLTRKQFGRSTDVFLISTALTSLTGYGFPFEHLLPSHIIGALSLGVLAIASIARYRYRTQGASRRTYVISAAVALYFNVFVLVVQAFRKVPSLKALAPKGSEPPFAIVQLLVLATFIVLTTLAAKRFPV